MTDILFYGFFLKALAVIVLTSVTCGIIGTYIVTRRIVFISDGITHASFGGIGLGYLLGLNPIFMATVFGIISAFGIRFLTTKGKIREDSTIGIFLAFGMALGIIFIYLTPGYAPDLTSYLFGNILTVTYSDILFISTVTILILAIYILLYKEILAVSFDETFAKTQKVNVELINYLMIALVALSIVVNIRIAGVILVISLLTIPQSTAMLLTKKFSSIVILSIIFGLITSFTGLILSFYLDIPSGASIVFTEVIFFGIIKSYKVYKKS